MKRFDLSPFRPLGLVVGLLVLGGGLWLAVGFGGSFVAGRGDRWVEEARRLHRADRPDEAWDLFHEVVELAQRRRDPKLKIRGLLGLAAVDYGVRGDLDSGVERLEEGLRLARSLSPEDPQAPSLEADVLSSLGVFYWFYRRQRQRVVDDYYEPAMALYDRVGDRGGMGFIHGRLALVDLAANDYEGAAEHLGRARRLFEAIDDDVALTDIHRYLGVLFEAMERHDLARQHHRMGLELCRRSHYQVGCRSLEVQQARLHLRLREFDRAEDILSRWIATGGGSAYSTRNHLLTHGHALLHLGRAEEARVSYRRALDIDLAAGYPDARFRAEAWTMLAHADMQRGDLATAGQSLDRVEAIPIGDKGWGPTVLHSLARADLAAHEGHPERALGHLLVASELESLTFGSGVSLFFRTQYRQVFDRLFSALFEDVVPQVEAEALAFRFIEQMRYRSFRSVIVGFGGQTGGERSQTAEEGEAVERIDALSRQYGRRPTAKLWDELKRAYAVFEDATLRAELTALRYGQVVAERPVELAVLQERLAANQGMVHYVVVGERMFALLITRQGTFSALVPTRTANVWAKVKLFRHLLFAEAAVAADGHAPWRPLAEELGRLLVEPLQATGGLDGVEHLILVPMGDLHDLPFAALADSTGRLLVERFILSRTPSASLWSRRDVASAKVSPDVEIAAFGLRQARGSKLQPLAYAEHEAAAVAQAVGGVARLDRQATEAAVKRLAPRARRLHIATHGLAEAHLPLHSRLVLQAGEGDDGALTVREILDLDLAAEWVTLSACGTGLSSASGGDAGREVDRLGFVEAFLHGGAEHVLATLLPVSDAATAALMTDLYGRTAATSAATLAATRRHMVAHGTLPGGGEGDLDLRHPRYWAPFILVSARQGR